MSSDLSENTNVDSNEIDKFNSIAASWWDMEGSFKPLHKLNPVRVSYIQQMAGSVAHKELLDIGCGGGILAESLAKLSANVVGIDLAQDSLDVAKLHALEAGVKSVRYQNINAEDFSQQHYQQFDIVTCMEMLEHVPDPESIICAAANACKPGGRVFFSTLNKTAISYLLAIVGAEKVLKLVPNGTHEFEKFIKPAQLIQWAERYGLKIRDAIGLHYNPLNEQFTLKPNIDVNYILYFEKLDQ